MKARFFELGSVVGAGVASVASAAASLCCIGPLALTLLGVQGAIFAAGIKPYRGYLLGASFLLLGTGHWGVWRKDRAARADATEGAACSVGAGRWTKRILWGATALFFAAVVIQFLADRYQW